MELEYAAITCLRCGYLRESADPAPEYACPKCGAVYAKLEAARIADLEAREDEARATANAAIRAESESRFDADQRKREVREAPARAAAHAIYLLYALPFAFTQFGGLLLAYKMRRLGDDSWLNNHFTWQIRTFWYLLAPSLVGVVALLTGGAATTAFVATRQDRFLEAALGSLYVLAGVAVTILLVYVFRVGKGWYSLWRQTAPW